ncbi:hypothetical protein O181_000293 [Austropuccinia psidii MF-1]|uniref:Uncharacterized protein n=1 Tax=Austropuccinia psidii MF-1 TaxID=1389203 RepID=A0A9Q3B8B6_9BASI|nr:hypothetical protein [Austropuccinia psidii MF-1]
MIELPSFPSFEWDSLGIDTPKGEDLILGFQFLDHFYPSIDWRKGLITSLVGDYRASSFPSSVHIPSLNSHHSLLSSRDEFSTEIQDVGEDNSVSSLHIFFGNMDLPPSSYHNSMDELWDEEEEQEDIETVIKIVSSTSPQYLYVFSKVKAERLPPHRTCDHHIELEGSL